VLTYALLAMLLLRRRLGLGLRVLAPAVIVWIGLTAWTQRTAPPPSVAQLNVLAVGGGQCAVLRCPSGRTFLLDAGTRSGFDVYQQALEPFLQARRLPRPDAAFVSHANTDHYNAIPSYLSEHRLGRVYTSRAVLEAKALAPDAAASANHLLARLWDSGADVRTLGAGQKVDLDERTSVEVLWPPEGYDAASANDSSLVLRVTCDQRSALVCGDIEEGPQRALLERPERLRCDVLVLPHHGSWEPSLPEFVAACGAQVVLASSPTDPCAAVRSDPAAIAFYRQLAGGGRFHCTARNGWIGARFGRGVLDVQTAR
jgi:competence protein ComEC